jgi:hypothetical protein
MGIDSVRQIILCDPLDEVANRVVQMSEGIDVPSVRSCAIDPNAPLP